MALKVISVLLLKPQWKQLSNTQGVWVNRDTMTTCFTQDPLALFAVTKTHTVQQNKANFSAFFPQESIKGEGSYLEHLLSHPPTAFSGSLLCYLFDSLSPLLCLSFLDPQTSSKTLLIKATVAHTCHFLEQWQVPVSEMQINMVVAFGLQMTAQSFLKMVS